MSKRSQKDAFGERRQPGVTAQPDDKSGENPESRDSSAASASARPSKANRPQWQQKMAQALSSAPQSGSRVVSTPSSPATSPLTSPSTSSPTSRRTPPAEDAEDATHSAHPPTDAALTDLPPPSPRAKAVLSAAMRLPFWDELEDEHVEYVEHVEHVEHAERVRKTNTTKPTAVRRNACHVCHGVGFILLDVPPGSPNFGKLFPCSCREADQHRSAGTERAVMVARLKEGLGELAECTLENFDTDRPLDGVTVCYGVPFSEEEQRGILRWALDLMYEYVDSLDGWIFLCGPCGSGKSHLAVAAANRVVSRYRNWNVGYASVPEMLDFIRQGFEDNSATVRIEALQDVDFLVVDDIGAEYMTKWSEETLFRIINFRYRHALPTIFTSNSSVDTLPERISSRIIGRVFGDMREFLIPVCDYRKLQHAQNSTSHSLRMRMATRSRL